MWKFWSVLALCGLSINSYASWDGEVRTKEEVALLPPYCKGTQLIRQVSGDNTDIEVYKSQYGPEFWHLHHYCWALNAERKAIMAPLVADSSKGIPSRWSLLEFSRTNIDYFLKRSSDSFMFLPEILVTNARVLYQLDRKGEAIASLSKAIRIKKDYWPAYVQLSDYYRSIGNKKIAIKTLQDGLEAIPGNKRIIRRLKEFGVEPDSRFLAPLPAENSVDTQTTGHTRDSDQIIKKSGDTPNASTHSPANNLPEAEATPALPIGNKTNPYCRFCPD